MSDNRKERHVVKYPQRSIPEGLRFPEGADPLTDGSVPVAELESSWLAAWDRGTKKRLSPIWVVAPMVSRSAFVTLSSTGRHVADDFALPGQPLAFGV